MILYVSRFCLLLFVQPVFIFFLATLKNAHSMENLFIWFYSFLEQILNHLKSMDQEASYIDPVTSVDHRVRIMMNFYLLMDRLIDCTYLTML